MLADDLVNEGGIRTRVTEELSCLRDVSDVRVLLASRCYARNLPEMSEVVPSVKRDTGLQSMAGLTYPKFPHGGSLMAYEVSIIANVALTLLVAIPWAAVRRARAVYGHNIECGMAAVLLSKLLRIPAIVDSHGVEVDEHLERHPTWKPESLRIKFLRLIERFVLTRADAVVCVSSAHREAIKESTGRIRDVHVVPCFTNQELFNCAKHSREDARARMGVGENEVLFVYAGLTPEPYDVYSPVHMFSNLGRLENKKLLLLSPGGESLDAARRQVSSSISDRVIIASVPRSAVPEHLCASDIGILLRRETIVNRVASPTKFSEYLLCGLPVVITDKLGDSSSLVRDNKVGVVLSGTRILTSPAVSEAEIASIVNKETRLRARHAGEAHLSKRVHTPAFVDIIRSNLKPV